MTEEEKIAELLKPRYELIAGYPGSPNVGMIFSQKNKVLPTLFYDEDDCDTIAQDILNKYPHLFHKLNWWEKRRIDEMPLYLKYVNRNNGKVRKVGSYITSDRVEFCSGANAKINNRLEPATEQDYINYINQKL